MSKPEGAAGLPSNVPSNLVKSRQCPLRALRQTPPARQTRPSLPALRQTPSLPPTLGALRRPVELVKCDRPVRPSVNFGREREWLGGAYMRARARVRACARPRLTLAPATSKQPKKQASSPSSCASVARTPTRLRLRLARVSCLPSPRGKFRATCVTATHRLPEKLHALRFVLRERCSPLCSQSSLFVRDWPDNATSAKTLQHTVHARERRSGVAPAIAAEGRARVTRRRRVCTPVSKQVSAVISHARRAAALCQSWSNLSKSRGRHGPLSSVKTTVKARARAAGPPASVKPVKARRPAGPSVKPVKCPSKHGPRAGPYYPPLARTGGPGMFGSRLPRRIHCAYITVNAAHWRHLTLFCCHGCATAPAAMTVAPVRVVPPPAFSVR